jgi:hypothetical protein
VKRRKWRIPQLRQRFPFQQSSSVISIQVCGNTLLPIWAPRHSRTSKKQGNGKADGGGQVSHMKSLAESWNGANTLAGALRASRSVGDVVRHLLRLYRPDNAPKGAYCHSFSFVECLERWY